MYKKNESGQAAIIIAIALVAMIAFVALAIDAGNAYTAKREAQNAADAAALAATRQLVLECSLGGDGAVAGRIRDRADELVGANNGDVSKAEVYYTLQTADGYTRSGYQIQEGVDVPCGCGVGTAQGVEIVVSNPTQSFLAGIVGVDTLGAKATGKARYAPLAVVSSGLYPITRPYDPNMQVGQVALIRFNGSPSDPVDSGNFGWLTWNGKWGAKTLQDALANGGYFNHDTEGYCDVVDFGPPTQINCAERTLSIGEYVQGQTGNVASTENELIDLMNNETVIAIPLYGGTPQGHGSNYYYQVAAFGAFQLVEIDDTGSPLSKGNDKYINTIFQGFVLPGDWMQGCFPGGIQSVKLTP